MGISWEHFVYISISKTSGNIQPLFGWGGSVFHLGGKVNVPSWIQDTGEKQLWPKMCRPKLGNPTFFNNRNCNENLCFWFSKLPEIAWQLAQWQVNPLQVDWLDPTMGYNDEDGFFAKGLKTPLKKKNDFFVKTLDSYLAKLADFVRGFTVWCFCKLLGRLHHLTPPHGSPRIHDNSQPHLWTKLCELHAKKTNSWIPSHLSWIGGAFRDT